MNGMPTPDAAGAVSSADRRSHDLGSEQHRRLADSWGNRLSMLVPGLILLLAVSLLMVYLFRLLSG